MHYLTDHHRSLVLGINIIIFSKLEDWFFQKKDLKTEKKVRKPAFIKKPLSNIDLMRWCDFLRIRIKGIFSRDEHMPKDHSPCILNLDGYKGGGSHWVCCIPGHKKRYSMVLRFIWNALPQ